jgi:hypothetical protein
MPPIQIPLVKPDSNTRMFICPKCKVPFAQHADFAQHFVAEHTPAMTPPPRGPEVLEVK